METLVVVVAVVVVFLPPKKLIIERRRELEGRKESSSPHRVSRRFLLSDAFMSQKQTFLCWEVLAQSSLISKREL